MTMGYGCAGEDCRNPVNWLLTHLQPAATLSVCDDHYPVFAIGMLAVELGVDTGRLYDVIRKHVDREAKRLQAEAEAAEAAEAQAAADHLAEDGHESGPLPMSRWAEEQTESGGLVIDQGPPS